MDEKQNENSPKVGDTYMSLDQKLDDIYYRITEMIGPAGSIQLRLNGVLKETEIIWPLLFLEQKFVKVNETTVQILFGKGEKSGQPNDNQKG